MKKEFKIISQKQIKSFHKKIFEFYKEHKRNLPWRKTTNPYYIMISEIMLQQTQVPRVIEKYDKWIQQFPKVEDLAQAELKLVLQLWSGLGFNSRGKRLQDTAKIISKKYKGIVPNTPEELETLPGIGPYTSKAILIFANNENIATVDTNIRRILIHEFKLSEDLNNKEIQKIAEQILPKGKSRDWHNALMDYGTTIITARKSGIKSKGKQSTFKGSRREVRAGILKNILNEEKITVQKAKKLFPKTQYNVKEILEELVSEEIITKNKNTYEIK